MCFSESTLEAPLPDAIQALVDEAIKNEMGPVGHSVEAKLWRTYIAIGHHDPLITKHLMEKITSLGFSDCKKEAVRNVPGSEARKVRGTHAPEFHSKKLSAEQLKDFHDRVEATICKYNVNDYVQYTTLSAAKP